VSVRLRKWKKKDGTVELGWMIDVKVAIAGQRPPRVRDFSPVNTRRGAEQYERYIRDQLLAGTFGKEVKLAPTVGEFEERFLAYSEVNNKPSTVYGVLGPARALRPALREEALDGVGAADVELYKAKELKEGQ
jgi:hypothetical protein